MELDYFLAPMLLAVGIVVLGLVIHWMVTVYEAASEVRDYYRRRNAEHPATQPLRES